MLSLLTAGSTPWLSLRSAYFLEVVVIRFRLVRSKHVDKISYELNTGNSEPRVIKTNHQTSLVATRKAYC